MQELKQRIAVDVTGLAWRYSTGVQNLYRSLVDGWLSVRGSNRSIECFFYDRSGKYNAPLSARLGASYVSSVPRWWPDSLALPAKAGIRYSGRARFGRDWSVNHVWNWDIFHPPWSRASINIPDILPVEYPQWFDDRFRRMTDRSLAFAADRAEYVFVISNDVKARLVRHLGIAPDRVHVVYPAINPAFLEAARAGRDEMILRRFGLKPQQYFLSYGFLEPRKNIVRQLQAFRDAIERSRKPQKFVLIGLETSRSRGLNQEIENVGLQSHIVRVPYLPLEDVVALLRHSTALAYCSVAEGFGLPIVEAMAAGATVITSNTTSMAELGTNRCELANPLDVEDISAAFIRAMNPERRGREETLSSNRKFAAELTPANWLIGHLRVFEANAVYG